MSQHGPDGAFEEDGRKPPMDVSAEECVLGGILLCNDKMDDLEDLRGDDFYREKHRRIYSAMLDLWADQQPIDLVTLGAKMKERGEDGMVEPMFLAYLAGRVPTAANIRYYAQLVMDAARKRWVIGRGTEIVGMAYRPDVTRAELELALDQAAASAMAYQEGDSGGDVSAEVHGLVEPACRDSLAGKGGPSGLLTGIRRVDRITGGLLGGDYWVVGARPSHGKTMFALNLAEHVARSRPVLVLSLEQSKAQVVRRLVASLAEVTVTAMRDRTLSREEVQRVRAAANFLRRSRLRVDDGGGLYPSMLRAKARAFARRYRGEQGLAVIDYLQLMSPEPGARHEGRTQELAGISRAIKQVAKEINWPVLALSQLNRAVESREDKRPNAADLRDSGAIEQDADVVGFIYRPEMYRRRHGGKDYVPPDVEMDAELLVDKVREGDAGYLVKLACRPQYMRFYGLGGDGFEEWADPLRDQPLPGMEGGRTWR